MNKLKYILSIISIITIFGCEDFLEPQSKDKIVPKDINDLKEFLLGEVIKNKQKDPTLYLAYMTDDISDHFYYKKKKDKKADYWGYYTWQQEPETTKDNTEKTDYAWDIYYHKIFICNVILDHIPDMTGTQMEKDIIAAETYFMRAHCYFMLVNLYGEPYDKTTASTALGVPINNETGIVNARYMRSSVETVYQQIEDDLVESIKLFKDSRSYTSVARPSLKTAYLLMSRMFLFKKDYVNTEKYAGLAIRNSENSIVDLKKYGGEFFMSKSNPEILFTYGLRGSYSISRMFNAITYRVSNDILNEYSDSDLRKSIFFYGASWGWKPKKYKDGRCNTYGKAYRLYEAYLNRAEANAELDKTDLALNDLKFLYSYRHDDEENISASTKDEIISLIRKERRLEFCFEDFRWFDLRRYGMPELEHSYITPDGELSYTLEAKSKAYTLPIPKKVRDLNLEIERINRPQQK